MKICAIDPGGVTGIAMRLATDADFSTYEVEGYYEAASFLSLWLDPDVVDLVVCESFTISQRTIKTKQDHSALRLIGWLDIVCQQRGIPFEFQSPADAKRFSSDGLLKKLGWYQATPGGHTNDALRHLLLAIVRRDPQTAKRLLA
jgi:hypothetical protein